MVIRVVSYDCAISLRLPTIAPSCTSGLFTGTREDSGISQCSSVYFIVYRSKGAVELRRAISNFPNGISGKDYILAPAGIVCED